MQTQKQKIEVENEEPEEYEKSLILLNKIAENLGYNLETKNGKEREK
ncbi:hypothetical protein ES703_31412 [subsurface metagenome]